jgi:hypothetical protein
MGKMEFNRGRMQRSKRKMLYATRISTVYGIGASSGRKQWKS